MKTATYHTTEGREVKVEYDEAAPCIVCGEPVLEASVGGTVICPWCDCGNCRYCGKPYLTGREQTREECEAVIRAHVASCKLQKSK